MTDIQYIISLMQFIDKYSSKEAMLIAKRLWMHGIKTEEQCIKFMKDHWKGSEYLSNNVQNCFRDFERGHLNFEDIPNINIS
jgi:hypothetical protein